MITQIKNRLHRLFSYWLLAVGCWLISSCQKVITFDLNSVNPKLVIQGNITNQPGPYTIQLSHTVNVYDPNVFPAVSGASVIVSDNVGTIDTLKEISSGIYRTSKLLG